MEQTVLQSKKGMSLIEVLVSLVLLAIVAMAVLQSTLVTFRQTTTNQLREEAVRIGEETTNRMRALAFTKSLISPGLTAGVKAPETLSRTIRGYPVSYTVEKTVVDLGTAPDITAKQVDVTVRWPYRGQTFTHTITSIIGRS